QNHNSNDHTILKLCGCLRYSLVLFANMRIGESRNFDHSKMKLLAASHVFHPLVFVSVSHLGAYLQD
ncbi:hypothetical protein STEG23_020901, partial [Scotinomys teguina]